MKMVAITLVTVLAATSTAAYASANAIGDQCGGDYTYLKGPESSWPAWAQSSVCVRPWSDNPMAKYESSANPTNVHKNRHAE